MNDRCDPSFFVNEQFREATRTIDVEFCLTEPDSEEHSIDVDQPPADAAYPRLYVTGSGVGHFGHGVTAKGHVDRYVDGTIQWTLVGGVSISS